MIMSPKEFAEKYFNMRTYFYPPELTEAQEDKGGYDAPTGWQFVRCEISSRTFDAGSRTLARRRGAREQAHQAARVAVRRRASIW